MQLGVGVLAGLFVGLFCSLASAQEENAKLPAELARQGAALERLERAEAERTRTEQARVASNVVVSGYVQVDWVLHNQASQNELNEATGAPLNQDRFTIRRGRVRVSSGQSYLSGALELDANTTNGVQVRPINVELDAHWPEREDARLPFFVLSAGLIRIPFGFEVVEADSVRPFLERSTAARAFFPGEFDLGARFQARYRFLSLSVAAMNGHPIGDRLFPALAPNAKKEVVGHIGTHVELVPGFVLDLGLSADTGSGFHPGSPTTKDQLVWRDENGDGLVGPTEVQVIAGSSAAPSQQFHRFALGADLRLGIQFAAGARCELRAEVTRASNLDRAVEIADPVGSGYDLRELGWYLGVTQEVTRWGMVGIRYDQYDPDQDATEQGFALVPRNRSYSTLALLALLRYGEGRLSFEYDRNRNALGRSANGSPTSLASDVVTMRAQLKF